MFVCVFCLGDSGCCEDFHEGKRVNKREGKGGREGRSCERREGGKELRKNKRPVQLKGKRTRSQRIRRMEKKRETKRATVHYLKKTTSRRALARQHSNTDAFPVVGDDDFFTQ